MLACVYIFINFLYCGKRQHYAFGSNLQSDTPYSLFLWEAKGRGLFPFARRSPPLRPPQKKHALSIVA